MFTGLKVDKPDWFEWPFLKKPNLGFREQVLSNQEPSSGRSTTATAPHDVMYGEGRGVNIVLSTKKRTKNLVFLHLVITFEYILSKSNRT